MCDSLVADGTVTADGTVILAKNSDRQPNEAHVLEHVPRATHSAGTTVQCTYIQVPQVAVTNEVLLSRPFWIWGAEMGANEFGVAIGNEAVFTKEPYDKKPGLIGMDMLRLALERAGSAREALEVIIGLLETYGQGGNCGFRHKEYYHNSFIIADLDGAWVLETAGRFWAAERVRGVRTISNGLTIGAEWDLASPGLVEHAMEKGWCRSQQDFHFARCYSDRLYTNLDGCRTRQRRSTELLESQHQSVGVGAMMASLRDHGSRAEHDPRWNPGKGWLMETLCVHASLGPTRPGQTTGSMVAHLAPGLQTYWLTGTAAPCTGLFKPVFLGGAGLPEHGPAPAGIYDPKSLWWEHERLHRAVIRDYPTRLPRYRAERDELEADFVSQAASAYTAHRDEERESRAGPLAALTADCFERSAVATARWIDTVRVAEPVHRPTLLFSIAWDILNRQARFPGS